MKRLIFIFYMMPIIMCAQNSMEWTKRMGGTTIDIGKCMAVDASGNVYTGGTFAGTVDFDPGPGTFNLIAYGATDAFVAKFDTQGNFLWAKKMGGTGFDDLWKLTLDASGNVYTIGYFSGTSNFDQDGSFNLTSSGSDDIFISKLSSSGDFVWAKSFAGASDARANTIAVDDLNNVIVGGYFEGTLDFDTGSGSFNLTSAGIRDMFITKLDANGNLVWVNQVGNTGSDGVLRLTISNAGNIHTLNYFQGMVDFDADAGTFNLNSPGTYNLAMAKYDSSGNFIWAKQLNSESASGTEIVVDDTENIYLSGSFTGTSDFDPSATTFNLISAGLYDIYVCKYNASGDLIWAKSMGGLDHDEGYSLAVDAVGNIYTTGYLSQTCDFDPGAGVYNLSSNGLTDIFVSKLDPLGNLLWAVSIGASGSDYAAAIKLDEFSNVYLTGWFSETVDFDPGTDTYELVSSGLSDIFVAKLGCEVASGVDIQQACGSYTWMDGITYTSSNDTVTYIIPEGAVNGCDSVVTLNLTIESPNASVTDNGAILTANAIGASYQWINCDEMLELIGDTNQVFIAPFEGDFAVIVTENDCSDTSTCYNVSGLSATENYFGGNLIKLYPNPTTGRVIIDFNVNFQNITVAVRDVLGQKLENINFAHTNDRIELQIKEISGIYFIEVNSGNHEHGIFKVIVQ